MKKDLAIFEGHEIRRIFDEKTETWFFSVVDIIRVLTKQADYQTARKYWNKLKERLGKEGSQSVTNCHRLKLPAADGKSYLTDVASAETLLRLVQSVPSPKAEPIKLWLAKVGYERMQEMSDPAGDDALAGLGFEFQTGAFRNFTARLRGGLVFGHAGGGGRLRNLARGKFGQGGEDEFGFGKHDEYTRFNDPFFLSLMFSTWV